MSTIHYVLILDKSGSMQQLKKEVISSFNEQVEMIRKMRENNPENDIRITLCVFNDLVEFRYLFESIEKLQKIRGKDYQPMSCTALFDAIGITFLKLQETVVAGEKVFVAIFTDGLENASTTYSNRDIRHKLNQAEKDGWMVKFFCRYEDSNYYQERLNLSKNQVFDVSLDANGLKVMESEIMFSIGKLSNSKNTPK